MCAVTRPCLIGLDWGTSSLRAMLIDGAGRVIEEQARPWGITHLPPGGFRAAYDAVTAAWPGLPCLAAGMVGSRQGWVEAPYCDAPAGVEALASRLATVAEVGMFIVPGIVLSGGRSDVMRGEETQVIGALGDGDRGCMVLPGSHSKWVDVEAGRIIGFRTFMTGEVFAALRDHTILGAFPAPETSDQDSFDRGVRTAHDATDGISSLLFSVRALGTHRPAARERGTRLPVGPADWRRAAVRSQRRATAADRRGVAVPTLLPSHASLRDPWHDRQSWCHRCGPMAYRLLRWLGRQGQGNARCSMTRWPVCR